MDDQAPSGPTQNVVVNQAETNGLGTASFVTSLVGIVLTCGFLCPLGLLFGLIAMFKRPRGMAIAGVIIGAAGSLWAILGGIALFLGMLGLGAGLDAAGKALETTSTMLEVRQRIVQETPSPGAYPESFEDAGIDAWGRPIRYARTPGGFELRSAGFDGEFDTEDDLVSDK